MKSGNKPEIMSDAAQRRAGTAAIALGLATLFVSFGLLITRKNNGQTHYDWLGADDYFVMGFLMLGGAFTAWAGKELYLAGDNRTFLNSGAFATDRNNTKGTNTLTPLDRKILAHVNNAHKHAIIASSIFLVMSFYAFLGGFTATPTPESHIGPDQHNNTQVIGFSVLYGVTAALASAMMYQSTHERTGKKIIHVGN